MDSQPGKRVGVDECKEVNLDELMQHTKCWATNTTNTHDTLIQYGPIHHMLHSYTRLELDLYII